jgi:L-amino acid N-acyltransferase YncA
MTVSTESITIRPATDADMDAAAAIYAHHVLHGCASFETEPPTAAEMRRRRADVVGKGLPYFVTEQVAGEQAGSEQAVIESVSEVVGYAYASAYRPRAAYANTIENSVYLHPNAIGRGIGRRLLSTLVAA